MERRMCGMVLVLLLLISIAAHAEREKDPELQQAQQKLDQLGYGPGVADGLFGQRTRLALEAFQGAQGLPKTGKLDTATLKALDRAIATALGSRARALRQQDAPLRVVLHYLRLYAYQPARVLPFVTEHFRHDMTPAEWINQTRQTLAEQEYAYLSWKIQRLEVADTQATVEVHTRVRMQGKEIARQEEFTLRRVPPGGWLIDAWHVGPLPATDKDSTTDS